MIGLETRAMEHPSYSPFESPEQEIAWAAGLFEGEGTFCANKAKRAGGFSFYPRAQLASTDHDVILRFQEAVGVGKIRGPYDKNGSAGIRPKPIYFWTTNKPEEFAELVNMFWDLMCERRRDQIRSVHEKINSGVHALEDDVDLRRIENKTYTN